MAVTTKKTFNAVGSGGQSSTTVFTPVSIELNNQDDLDVYVTLSGGTRVLQYNQSTGSTTDSNHPQVNDTTGLYFPAQSAGVTLYNYTISTDNNTITFNSALPSGAVVSIERRTRDSSGDYTNFAGGSTIRHTDVNAAFDESNFTGQEARNKAFELEGTLFDGEAKDDIPLNVEGIDLDDNKKIRLGTGKDLQLYHNGTNSFIDNETGHFYIQNSGSNDDKNIYIRARDGENSIRCEDDAGVTLYFNNAAKIATTDTGATLTGVLISDGLDLGDNEKIEVGTGNDLEIYHGGTNSWFKNDTGDLVISCGSDDIRLAAKDDIYLEVNATDSGATSTENGITVHGNGGVKLYYDNVEKVRTRADGAIVYGTLFADGIDVGDDEKIVAGASDDLEIYHNTNSYINNKTGHLYIQNIDSNDNSNIYIRARNEEHSIVCHDDGAVKLYYNGVEKISTSANGISVTGTVFADGLELGDSERIKIGSGDDLQIWHDGSHSRIKDTGTGALYIDTNDIRIMNAAEDEYLIRAIQNSYVKLYHDSNEKLATDSTGVIVTGKLTADSIDVGDNEKLLIGASDDLEIYHDPSGATVRSYINNNTGHLYIQNGGSNDDSNIYIRARDEDSSIICKDDGAVELFYDNHKKLETVTGGVYINGHANVVTEYQVAGVPLNLTHLANVHDATPSDGQVLKWINANSRWEPAQDSGAGGASLSDGVYGEITVASSGSSFTINDDVITGDNLANNLDIPDNNKIRFGTGDDLQIYHDGTNSIIKSDTGTLVLRADLFALTNNADNESLIRGTANGAVELYYNNVKKFETSSIGVTLTGDFTNHAGSYINNSGGHVQINHDSGRLKLGASDDLQIYHDGSYSYIDNTHSGGLWIRGGTSTYQIGIQAKNSENSILCTGDGAVNLYYDGTKKCYTGPNGLKFDDNDKALFGNSGDLQIYHDGTDSKINNSTGNIYIQNAGANDASNIYIRAKDGEDSITCEDDGPVKIYYDAEKKLQTTAAGIDLYDDSNPAAALASAPVQLVLNNTSTHNWDHDEHCGALIFKKGGNIVSAITGTHTRTGSGHSNEDGGVQIWTSPSAEPTVPEQVWEFDSLGSFVGKDDHKILLGNSNDLQVWHDGTHSYIRDAGASHLRIENDNIRIRNGASNETMIAATVNDNVGLYYDANPKLQTTSTGAKVFSTNDAVLQVTTTGTAATDDARIEIITQESTFTIQNDRSLGTDGALTISPGSDKGIDIYKDGAVELYYNNVKTLQTTDAGVDIDDALHIYNSGAHAEGHIILRPRGTSTDNDHVWIGTRDNATAKYRFTVDGDGEIRSNSAHFAGIQRDDSATPTNHYNTTDRIRYNAYRGTTDNANYRARALFGTASSDWDDYRCFYYVDAQDDAAVDYDADQTISFSGSGRGNFKSNVWAGRVESDEASPNSVYALAERGFTAFADDSTDQTTCIARNVADATHVYYSEVNNQAHFSVEADGTCRADDTTNLSNADYAESFEWTDGNASNQERRGMTVILDGEKVKLATDSDNKDNIIGVVSPNPAVLGDSASLGWHGRYKRDIYGTPIRKAYEWLVWRKEYTYVDGVKTLCAQPDPTNPKTLEHGDVERVKVEDIEKLKAKHLIPDFAITNNIRYTSYAKDIDTTDYDTTKAYIPRKDRKEWDAIGMVGKLIVRRGQPVGTRWLLMKQNIGTDTDGTVLDRYLVR